MELLGASHHPWQLAALHILEGNLDAIHNNFVFKILCGRGFYPFVIGVNLDNEGFSFFSACLKQRVVNVQFVGTSKTFFYLNYLLWHWSGCPMFILQIRGVFQILHSMRTCIA